MCFNGFLFSIFQKFLIYLIVSNNNNLFPFVYISYDLLKFAN